MKKFMGISVFAFVAGIALLSTQSFAQVPTTCPNMNGTFKHSELLGSGTITVTQTGCTSMHVVMVASIVGTNYNEDQSSPLDGVTRPVTSTNAKPNEKDTLSAEWNGDTAVFTLNRYVTDTSTGTVTQTTNQLTAELTSANVLHGTESDVASNGTLSNTKAYDFDRQ
jgi:hypothetical protein